MTRATVWIALSSAGVACALTLLFLAMRAVMDVGGVCAEGGPFEVRQECPQGVPGVMVGAIWGGLIFAGAYAFAAFRFRVPSFVPLLWSALFLSLGWNFFEYAFDPPGTGGLVWGWLVCGVLFALMGGLPLLAVLPWTFRGFFRESRRPPGWPGKLPVGAALRVAERVSQSTRESRIVNELERLTRLHEKGALDDDEFRDAKRKLLGKDGW